MSMRMAPVILLLALFALFALFTLHYLWWQTEKILHGLPCIIFM